MLGRIIYQDDQSLVWEQPPSRRSIYVQDGKDDLPERYFLRWPYMLFAANLLFDSNGQPVPFFFALGSPVPVEGPDSLVCHLPLPNTHPEGLVCLGRDVKGLTEMSQEGVGSLVAAFYSTIFAEYEMDYGFWHSDLAKAWRSGEDIYLTRWNEMKNRRPLGDMLTPHIQGALRCLFLDRMQ